MIMETFRKLASLDDDERATLALEPLQSVHERQQTAHVSPEMVRLLAERRAEFLERPERTKSWTSVKANLLSKYRGR